MIKNEENPYAGPYPDERKQIIQEIGDLETIRKSLGLSRRKICKLLLVDPSSWTRWTKEGRDAPAYIYRSLQWCLAIMDKYPDAHPLIRSLSYEKENKVDALSRRIEDRIGLHKSIVFDVQMEVNQIKALNLQIIQSNQKFKKLALLLGVSTVISIICFGFSIFI